jgi:DMSO reductase family type II enzyme molybdopterin subunit
VVARRRRRRALDATDREVTVTNVAQRWTWERSYRHSHCGNCIANCGYRLYTTDGEAVYQEVSGDIDAVDGVPDFNPLGCQKGAAWHVQRDSGDRLLYPLRRVGERGSGEWERISWDEALDTIADAILDAHDEEGAHAVLIDEGPQGGTLTSVGRSRFTGAIGAVALDGNSTVSDVHLGHWLTFGGLLGGSAADDTFRSDVILVWNGNPSFTRIPYYHYIPEARYRGATVVLVAPDYSPSAVHADHHVALTPGTDAALALAMCRVIVDDGLFDRAFVCSQTDLPLLVKPDGRFLRESDLDPGGRADRFYLWRAGSLAPADPARLDDPCAVTDVELEGRHDVTLADGTAVAVTPVFELLRARLADYAPEAAATVCGVHPDVIRMLARLVAGGRTRLYNGLGSCKHYHGDLMERAMDLVLALTGNWGRAGAGWDTYIIALTDGEVTGLFKRAGGEGDAEAALAGMDAMVDSLKEQDPTMTDGRAIQLMLRRSAPFGTSTPPAFFLYYHCGFDEIWDRAEWGASPRPMREYVKEARARGWWGGLVRPDPDTAPRVLIQVGTDALRRTRGGQRQLLRHLWDELALVVLVDMRMNTAGMYGDIVLPVACEGERVDLHAANSHSWERMFSDQAFAPRGEARSDWRIFHDLAAAVTRRAAARGAADFPDGRGGRRNYSDVIAAYTLGGSVTDEESALDDVLLDGVVSGNLPEGTTVARLRRDGWVRPQALPRAIAGTMASDLRPGEPFVSYREHVEAGVPFPTLTGRAQFYIDHPWFLEAGEELPVHKDPPPMGGDHPLQLTGGHPRWSIHATNTTSPMMLATTRGQPVVQLNPRDAADRGIADHDWVRVFNDLGSVLVHAKISPGVRPGQVVLYASWEPYLYPQWQDVTAVEPGMVKWLHFAGGYGHLGYAPLMWQPIQSDRLYRVDVERAEPGGAREQR